VQARLVGRNRESFKSVFMHKFSRYFLLFRMKGAGVIFLIGMALTEDDGVLLGVASILGCFAIALYALLFSVVFYYGASGLSEATQLIKMWF